MKRLEDLAVRLREGQHFTVAEVAQEFAVSPRTISRDIQILRDRGLPIDADRGRGGGIRLDRHWGLERVSFSYSEAVDLLVSLSIAEQMKSPFFMARLEPIRRKLMASFSAITRTRVVDLKKRILIGGTASVQVQAAFEAHDPAVVEALHQGFVQMRQLELRYRSESGAVTARRIWPHYLLLNYPIWYVLAWDELRQDQRTFRVDRILEIEVLRDSFELCPVSRFEHALAEAEIK